ncbi:flagellin [Denitrobaculum tricleocarpae]|uniref:Flagellin n=1 Tax=Denitrobaculum tricleocarpae TaxID=2591009 RepID=A0A545T3U3_9PROT|nr:flagellin [Denitrobaculum tricleocarpae]TQV71868.1 flagellin [Denitrobaculum tricleocarpae]
MPTVTTNTAANSALRFLNYNSMQSGKSVSKLASGSRIVQASDDAAGLAIGTRLNSDVTVLRQSAINASQGGSIMAVADGGLARIADVLQRLKALAAQSLSGVPTDTERGFIDAEFQSLLAEIDGMAATTRFNGDSLLDGTTTQQSYFVGTDPTDVILVDFSSFGGTGITNFSTSTSGGLSLSVEAVSTAVSATAAMTAVDTAIDVISEARANVGAILSRFEFRGQQINTALENVAAARSAIMDVDLAEEQSKLVSSQVLVQASVSALSQANQLPQSLLSLLQ